jgi:T-complex protein 1 subunit gamma
MNEVEYMCQYIIKWKLDIIVSEISVSDIATHHLLKHNISFIRRVRKIDN